LDCAENIQLHDLITLKEINYKAICMAEQYCPAGMLSEVISQGGVRPPEYIYIYIYIYICSVIT